MNNKRIDEILTQMWDEMPFARPLYAQPYIREAMEIYGKEQYDKGAIMGSKLGKLARKQKEQTITRLQDIVQAQKELISIYEKAITLGDPDVWELYSKIKSLES